MINQVILEGIALKLLFNLASYFFNPNIKFFLWTRVEFPVSRYNLMIASLFILETSLAYEYSNSSHIKLFLKLSHEFKVPFLQLFRVIWLLCDIVALTKFLNSICVSLNTLSAKLLTFLYEFGHSLNNLFVIYELCSVQANYAYKEDDHVFHLYYK